MRHTRKLAATLSVLLLSAVLLSGCWRHRYINSQAVSEVDPALWEWQHHLLWGIIKLSDDVMIDEVCPAGVARIDNWVGPFQVLFYVVTGGIYSPTTVRVWCAKPHVIVPVDVDVQLDEWVMSKLQQMYPDLEERLREALATPQGEEATVASTPPPAAAF